jgi:hypothetical protein
MVRDSAERMSPVLCRTGDALPKLLPPHRVRIVDGNHWRRTERRSGPLCAMNSERLPGHASVKLHLHLVRDVFPGDDLNARHAWGAAQHALQTLAHALNSIQ